MPATARTFIWAFFLLIFSNMLGIAAGKYGVPIRPVYVYAVVVVGLLITAVVNTHLCDLNDDWPFFAIFLVLATMGLLLYRGGAGPDFGGRILFPISIPSPAGYAIWPALNLGASISLYLFARQEFYRGILLAAALATLTAQVVTMGADMWWVGIFGDPNGRAGGLAQNANQAALVATLLSSLALPTRLGEQIRTGTINVLLVTVAAVLLTQSKTGAVLTIAMLAAFGAAKLFGSPGGIPTRSFVASLVTVIAGIVIFSPVLNGTAQYPTIVEVAHDLDHYNRPVELDGPINLAERIKLRTTIDDGVNYRREAFAFFVPLALAHPTIGLGTGFSNKFVTGPHNEFLKLAVDNGLPASLLFLGLLVYAGYRALKLRSPLLGSLVVISGIAAMFYHTLMPDPTILPIIAIGLGLTAKAPPSTSRTASSDCID